MAIAVMGEFRLPPERLAEARPLMVRLIEATRAEEGCILYSFAEDLGDPGLIRVAEKWESREHLARHFRTEHMAAWARERERFSLSGRQIAAYTIGDPEDI